MITRRRAPSPIPIIVTGSIIGIARGQPGITIIIQVADTPRRTHARRTQARQQDRERASYIQIGDAVRTSNDHNLPHFFLKLSISVDYNEIANPKILKKFFRRKAPEIKKTFGRFSGSCLDFWVKGASPLLAPTGPIHPRYPEIPDGEPPAPIQLLLVVP